MTLFLKRADVLTADVGHPRALAPRARFADGRITSPHVSDDAATLLSERGVALARGVHHLEATMTSVEIVRVCGAIWLNRSPRLRSPFWRQICLTVGVGAKLVQLVRRGLHKIQENLSFRLD